MKQITIGKSGLTTSAISLGCMRIPQMSHNEISSLVNTALENGITFFDHADIYGGGKSEEVFGALLKETPSLRDKMLLQSKCGIRPGMFDFSKEHILSAVDGSLARLHTDSLDFLLLHRPDALMEPDDVAEAFTRLKDSGKVRFFGVSNMSPMQIELLQQALDQPITANQLQFSAAFTGMVDYGLNVNMKSSAASMRDGGILEYSRLKNITIQAWSPLQYGFFDGIFLGSDKYPQLNKVLSRIAEEQQVSASAVAIAWILRHPANMQAILGTTSVVHLTEMSKAGDVELSKAQWYEIYTSAGNILP